MLLALAAAAPNIVSDPSPTSAPTVLLALGGLGLYLAGRFGTRALAGPGGFAAARAGTVALGQWCPVAAVAVAAAWAGRADVAVGVTFAASVAALSLAVGMIGFLVPNEPAPATRRAWPFLLPAALLPLLAGFGGALNLAHAAMAAGLGLAVWGVWSAAARGAADVGEVLPAIEPGRAAAGEGAPADGATGEAAGPGAVGYAAPVAEPSVWPRVAEWVLACGVTVVAAVAVVRGMLQADAAGVVRGTLGNDLSRVLRADLLAAGVIAPLLTLPLLAAGTDMAQRNRSGEACSACVGVALLNLLVLAPGLVVLHWARLAANGVAWPAVPIADPGRSAGVREWVVHGFQSLPSLPLPVAVWRIDAVVLTVLGLALLPVAMGRWRVGRLEAVGLILAYAGYLAVTAYLYSRRGGG